MTRVAVVGAGPAGIAAASLLVERGLQVVVIDEQRDAGGQVWRRPTAGSTLDLARVLGPEFDAYRRFHAGFEVLRPRIDWRPQTLVWNVHGRTLQLAHSGRQDAIEFDALILATGATDRVAPMPGWTLPGVFTLGGAQVLMKDQGCLIGGNVVFCGSSPLLYLAAAQYRRLGATVAVLDTTPWRAKLAALPRMLAAAGTLAKGLGLIAELKRAGVLIRHGVALERFEGIDEVAAVQWRDARGQAHRTACDAVAYGHGLRPESQLAELAGCTLRFDPLTRQYFPEADALGRCRDGVYVAGDGAAIGGAEAADISGRLAAMAVLRELGQAADPGSLPAQLAARRRFQEGAAQAFAWPAARVQALDDAVPVCRCENITAGEVRAVIAPDLGAADVNRMKAATRCGMGRCQGRFCGSAAAELTAAALGRLDAPLDRLRAQPPVKPIAIASAAGAAEWP
ncbi:MAG: FAD-dependent oxidoreductase [Alphaproteobacteria bacterium]|nr:FAD-dependent oxidoreductase [Alphaproteobacteria bacterium]